MPNSDHLIPADYGATLKAIQQRVHRERARVVLAANSAIFAQPAVHACIAAEFPDESIVKQLASQLPWWHLVRLLQRVKEADAREWYMRQAIREGWSRSVLELQMLGKAHERQGKAVTNFAAALPFTESRRAAAVFKDPYLFDFLGTTDLNRERQVEQALVDRIQRFMLELGAELGAGEK